MAGYVKTFRKMTEWQWYKNTNTKSLFIHCLLQANYKEKMWQGIEIKRGQFITSIDKLHLETGLTVREVRTALNNLISTNELTKETTSKYTVITVIKYSDYQSDDDIDDKEDDNVIDKQKTNKRQTNDKQTTTTNKDKKDNKENKVNNKDISNNSRFIKPSIDSIKQYIIEGNLSVDENAFFDYYESNGWRISGKSSMKDWKATLRNWDRREKQRNNNDKQETSNPFLKRLKEIEKNERETDFDDTFNS